MKHTLEDLKSGKLIGSKRLTLACGLTEFPVEIFSLADSLEILDLSDNNLSEIPDRISELKNLKILFFARNKFTEFPKSLTECDALTMIGFKTNQIHTVPENAFPKKLQWLILTDNKIKSIPKSIGDCGHLQKCALAGNLIEELPVEMAKCSQLELLRVSANKLKTIPHWLFQLPKLSWVAFGGNPGAHQIEVNTSLDSYPWGNFTIQKLIGEGASGFIYKASWTESNEEVAIKVFKGAVTSDGLPDDEMELSIAAGAHESLIPILGRIKDHPEEKIGLLMTLISPTYINLGNPPTWETCTRDVFEAETVFNWDQLKRMATSIGSVCQQLHTKGINHGDLYAHNILVNTSANSILGDFGAASYYDTSNPIAKSIERIEVRAFGCLIEDLFGLVNKTHTPPETLQKWEMLILDCQQPAVDNRSNFTEILTLLKTF